MILKICLQHVHDQKQHPGLLKSNMQNTTPRLTEIQHAQHNVPVYMKSNTQNTTPRLIEIQHAQNNAPAYLNPTP